MLGESLPQAATGMAGRDDDEAVGKIEGAVSVPPAGEKSDRRRQDWLVPSGEVAGEGRRGGVMECRSDGKTYTTITRFSNT